MSDLKQIGLALHIYAQDYDETLVPAGFFTSSPTPDTRGTYTPWMVFICSTLNTPTPGLPMTVTGAERAMPCGFTSVGKDWTSTDPNVQGFFNQRLNVLWTDGHVPTRRGAITARTYGRHRTTRHWT